METVWNLFQFYLAGCLLSGILSTIFVAFAMLETILDFIALIRGKKANVFDKLNYNLGKFGVVIVESNLEAIGPMEKYLELKAMHKNEIKEGYKNFLGASVFSILFSYIGFAIQTWVLFSLLKLRFSSVSAIHSLIFRIPKFDSPRMQNSFFKLTTDTEMSIDQCFELACEIWKRNLLLEQSTRKFELVVPGVDSESIEVSIVERSFTRCRVFDFNTHIDIYEFRKETDGKFYERLKSTRSYGPGYDYMHVSEGHLTESGQNSDYKDILTRRICWNPCSEQISGLLANPYFRHENMFFENYKERIYPFRETG